MDVDLQKVGTDLNMVPFVKGKDVERSNRPPIEDYVKIYACRG